MNKMEYKIPVTRTDFFETESNFCAGSTNIDTGGGTTTEPIGEDETAARELRSVWEEE